MAAAVDYDEFVIKLEELIQGIGKEEQKKCTS